MESRRRLVDRIADVFVLLPAGLGVLFLLLDFVPHATGLREPSSAPVFAGGVFLSVALRVWFRAEDRWCRRRLFRAARQRRRELATRAAWGSRGCGTSSAPRQR
jgi:hypothetical protein